MARKGGLETCHPTAGSHQRHHLANNSFRLGHVDQDKPHVRPVEGRARQPGVVCVSLADLYLCQRLAGDEAARQLYKMRAPFNAKN